MVSEQVPRAGEWWFRNDLSQRIYFVGETVEGVMLYQSEAHGLIWKLNADMLEWHHEPECTGWDWQPEVFPFYVGAEYKENAYVRIERDGYVVVGLDGSEERLHKRSEFPRDWQEKHDRPRLTKEQAESLVRKPQEPIPSDVYYSDADANFYHIETNRGMGNHFYEKWKARRVEFPGKPAPVESTEKLVGPSNQDLFEMVANLRDQMDGINKRVSRMESESLHHMIIGCN